MSDNDALPATAAAAAAAAATDDMSASASAAFAATPASSPAAAPTLAALTAVHGHFAADATAGLGPPPVPIAASLPSGPNKRKAPSASSGGDDNGGAATVSATASASASAPANFGYLAPPPASASASKYDDHTHGAKNREKKRLLAETGVKVSGAAYESEHTVGYNPLAMGAGLPRGKSAAAKELENHAPAYQESKVMHRAHIGTGTNGQRDGSGMNSAEYRDAQRRLVEAGDVSSAIQLNQLAYTAVPGFTTETGPGRDVSDASFAHMVPRIADLTYANAGGEVTVRVPPIQRVEMMLSRDAARNGAWPTRDEMAAAWKAIGYVDPYDAPAAAGTAAAGSAGSAAAPAVASASTASAAAPKPHNS